MPVLFAISEVTLILISVNFQSAISFKNAIVEISLIFKSIFNLLEMSFTMVFTISEITSIDSAISLFDFAIAIEFVMFEVAGVLGTVSGDEVTFTCFASILDRTFIFGSVSKVHLSVNKSVISEQTGLNKSGSRESTRSMVLVIFHVTLVFISILLGNDGVSAIAILEGALEAVPVGIVDTAFAIFSASFVYIAFVITTIEVGDLGGFCSHIQSENTISDISY